MKYENFKLNEIMGNSCLSWRFVAEVEEIKSATGCLWWKKPETRTKREVYRVYGSILWCFSDTGKIVDLIDLERSYCSILRRELQHIEVNNNVEG